MEFRCIELHGGVTARDTMIQLHIKRALHALKSRKKSGSYVLSTDNVNFHLEKPYYNNKVTHEDSLASLLHEGSRSDNE